MFHPRSRLAKLSVLSASTIQYNCLNFNFEVGFMRYVLLAAAALIAISGMSAAADKPGFSGEWKMNPSKSNYGPFPPPTALLRKVTLAAPSLVIVDNQTGGGADGTTTRTYSTDGKSSTFEINGAQVTGSAAWDGAAIVVTTSVESAGVSFKDKMSLSADAKELTSNVKIVSGQGDAELTIVFDRQ
jgi:hypothetical protein